jgi:hypothetical protein
MIALQNGVCVVIRRHSLTRHEAKAILPHVAAEVVYIDPDQPRHCGIRLAKPENIWGVSLLPDDWREVM